MDWEFMAMPIGILVLFGMLFGIVGFSMYVEEQTAQACIEQGYEWNGTNGGVCSKDGH